MKTKSLYWLLMCDDIRTLCEEVRDVVRSIAWLPLIIAAINGCCIFACVIVNHEEGTHIDVAPAIVAFAWLIGIGCALMLSAIVFMAARRLIPTTKQMAVLIVVPSLVDAIDNSEALKALPKKIVDLAGDWIETLSPKKKEAAKDVVVSERGAS